MNIHKINIKAGDSALVSITNYDSMIPIEWKIIQGEVQVQPDINDNVRKSAVITDYAPGESIIIANGSNRCIIFVVNTYTEIVGDLTAEVTKLH